jgi:hypothetical protein
MIDTHIEYALIALPVVAFLLAELIWRTCE